MSRIGQAATAVRSARLSVVMPVMLVGLAVLGAISVGIIGYVNAEAGLERAARSELTTLAEGRRDLLNERLDQVLGDLDNLTSSAGTQIALDEMAGIFTLFSTDIPLVRDFFKPAESAAADRALLTGGGSKTIYGFRHEGMHGSFASVWRNAGYGDVYILDAKGRIVYSVTKSDDFLMSVADDELVGSGLVQAFEQVAAADAGTVTVTGFAPYAPNGGTPAVFLAQAAPPGAKPDALGGYVVIRLDVDFFDAVLDRREGLGQTGQTYLINGSGQVLTNKPLSDSASALVDTMADQAMVQAAADGLNGETRLVTGGSELFAAAAPVDFMGAPWAVVAERSVGESLAAVDEMRREMMIGTLFVVVIATLIGILFSGRVVRPIARLTKTMETIAEGKYDVAIEGADKRNEVGEMARAVEIFRLNGIRINEMTEEERVASEQRRVDRATMMQDLQRAFGEVVDAAVAGDLSRRVVAEFPDEELNRLAVSVNRLVETVDRGISETGEVLSALAHTDLTRRVSGDYEGAFAQLKADTNAVAERLGDIVGQLKDTSRTLKTATGELLAGANDLSERTTRQAATIQETSAAMEQLASTVQQNAQRAKDASEAATGVTTTAEDGGEVMRDANVAMERITASSAKISSIIGLIDDIAFQTNLLALNASVEAARAGDAGKGFAVVAVEVRRLAQSAAQASSEVKALIEQSSTEVKGGTKLVAEAADKLTVMLSAARSANELMDRIAKESRDQAAAIEEVNGAVRQLDEMTQHNAALVEQTNAAIEQSETQARELDQIVDRFTVVAAPQAAPARAAPARAETPPAPRGIKGLQERIAKAAKTYLSRGNAAVDEDWAEF